MKKLFLSILIFTISTLQLIAQTEATTSDGKKIILNDNGTWKYKEIVKSKTNKTTISADDCSKYIVTEVDKVTGKSSITSKNMLIVSKDGGKKGFGMFLMQGEKSVILSIQAVGAGGCIDDDGKMNILFRDGTRLELTNDGKFNCDAKYTQYFGGYFGKKQELELFKTKEIETMRIWTSKSYVEENFTSDQSKELMKSINCLSTE
jgi:hypothetical protein